MRHLIERTAHHHHVDAGLALAVAWQESGWQQRRTSSTDAVGVMQIMPDTGTWMSLYAGRHLNRYGLHDNVWAGVVLLHVLRGQTSTRRAIGAYYQGLGAVQRHGFYPSTKHYLRNVLAIRRHLRHGWRPE